MIDAAAAPAIEIAGLSKRYGRDGKGTLALTDVDVTVGRHEFVTLVGPSGCGKSTLLKVISGIEPATSGSVRRFGEPVTGPTPDIGMVFQSPVLMKWRTILDNVLFPIDALGLRRRDYTDKAMALLKLAGLESFARARPRELSGGMQQRAALCRALIYDPPFLLMDEPFGALDALTRDQMNVELMRIWSETKKATLLITHSVAEAVFLADRVLVMSERPGTILADVAIDLPRPRQTSIRTTPAFGEYVRKLSAMLGVHD
ncbi:ABC transporter ATP-binding protein [Enhydrobacter sp.]|jgi:NitT/TauT family transport system ATP-binding protein|uniref:ABC transporter ATP-binding protein n=1 Tax=Enhydrobacter sp. TaxID=1894999 RepID=UPI00261513FF|nr:ABC transporter ATP-binding protein [Enhydrobacter sp.]WIM12794.1 MAG: ABC transporter, ATP-binding protein [Enhydrobacter sp.]